MNEPVTKELVIHKIKHNLRRLRTAIKWIIFSILSGLLIGMVGIAFYFGMTWVTDTRTAYPWLIFFLPLGGIMIILLYHLLHDEKDTGTNLVLSAIHSGDEIPLRMAPLIFISTLITHLFGGSAGREGAALQFGASLGNWLGRKIHLNESDKRIMTLAGMSAAFAALFGTPMAAALFPMEVISVGIMYYAALVTCVLSAFIGERISILMGLLTLTAT